MTRSTTSFKTVTKVTTFIVSSLDERNILCKAYRENKITNKFFDK